MSPKVRNRILSSWTWADTLRPGAKEWASEKPNLLNVAVSRAKRRLYIIDNREERSEYPNFFRRFGPPGPPLEQQGPGEPVPLKIG
jgi:hypothetical protein